MRHKQNKDRSTLIIWIPDSASYITFFGGGGEVKIPDFLSMSASFSRESSRYFFHAGSGRVIGVKDGKAVLFYSNKNTMWQVSQTELQRAICFIISKKMEVAKGIWQSHTTEDVLQAL